MRVLLSLAALSLALGTGCASSKPVVSASAAKYLSVSGSQFQLKDKVYFETGSANIEAKSFELLDAVAVVLKENPRLGKLRVEGHTDNTGEASANLKLSQERAESVVKYLVGKGIAAATLEAVGFGDTKPVASNETEEGKTSNRRVDFTIVK